MATARLYYAQTAQPIECRSRWDFMAAWMPGRRALVRADGIAGRVRIAALPAVLAHLVPSFRKVRRGRRAEGYLATRTQNGAARAG